MLLNKTAIMLLLLMVMQLMLLLHVVDVCLIHYECCLSILYPKFFKQWYLYHFTMLLAMT